jgi:hypothetical protein
MARKDLLTRLADAGEDAISKLGGAPGADRFMGVANSMRERIDELQKKVRGIDELERRVAALERRLDAQSTRAATTSRSRARKPAAKKPTTAGATSARKRTSSTRRTGGSSPG